MTTDDRHPALGPGDEDYLVERDVRLSESVLWGLQRRFYAAQDARTWGSGTIPSYVTTNAWVARAYARLLVHLLLDLGREDAERTVTILEVGAGSGRLGFLILTELVELGRLCGQGLPPFRYVLSDVSDASVAAWRAHPALQDWVDQGLLELTTFDLQAHPLALDLPGCGERFDAEHPGGPLVVVASYVLDALPQDAFRVRDGRLDEGRVSLLADHADPSATDPGLLGASAALFGWRPLDGSAYYGQPELDDLLASYRELVTDGAFGLPVGAVQVLDQLEGLTDGGLFLLSTDKGWAHPNQLEGQTAPYVMSHGCVSMMVDHHAIGRWVRDRGGQALLTSPRDGAVESALFALGGSAGLPLTRLAFDSELEAQSPSDFLVLAEALAAERIPDLQRVLSLLRLGAWDTPWLLQLLPAIEALGPDASPALRAELGRALDQVERRIFDVPGEPGGRRQALDRARAVVTS